VDKLLDEPLQSIGQEFGDDFHKGIKKRNWSEVIDSCWSISLRYKSDIGAIQALKTQIPRVEGIAEFIEVLLDDWLALFDKICIEPIRTR
jgi:hypothetical protein